uniref:ATP synthase subunit b, chloroplastic n=2 Tax=Roya TaxID=43942 RepID=A0A024B4D0_9VIRI|nr:CF0 subunit I of ATP synthase [Roya anglica]YP_009256851.1 CF0 subunit I of ATP synthase [Roya obtusa]AHZ11071.1 CF0 subunit I of ATP synthase [Roya anglica]ANI25913.1 CF0 subunit I of ATP synthase [Roya obtusa]
MNRAIDLIASLNDWALAEGLGVNTDLLDTNLINLAVVIGLLGYFGKGVLTTILSNRKEAILSTIRDAEERYQEATEKLNQAKVRLEQAKAKAEEIRINGISQIEREKQELIKAADEDSKRLEDSKNATIRFEEQKAIEEVRQQVSRLALQRAVEALNSRLNTDLHARMIDYHIGLFKSIEAVTE